MIDITDFIPVGIEKAVSQLELSVMIRADERTVRQLIHNARRSGAGRTFAYYFVEDVIQSCNFKTVRALIALNCQLEMLIYKGEVAQPVQLYKCNNRTWKKDLRLTAGMDVPTGGSEKDKVKEYLVALGVSIDELRGGKYTKKQVEDICDALGMALGTIHEHIIT